MLAELFTITEAEKALLLHGHHHHWLMLLSLSIAILSSSFAFQLASLVRVAATPALRQTALLSGSLTLGGGIWAMHFIGMLAFELPVAVRYDPLLTLLSVVPAILASWCMLLVMARKHIQLRHILVGGALMGSGIGLMHYTGTLALRTSAIIKLDPLLFMLSLLVALSMSMLAIGLRFGLRNRFGFSHLQTLILGGLGMGLAIASMHYTGMAATLFVTNDTLPPVNMPTDPAVLALGISLMVLTLGLVVSISNGILRYRYLFNRLQDHKSRLRGILDNAVDGIITINGQGLIQLFTPSAERIFGWRADEVLGRNINMLMPEPFHSHHDQYLARYLQTGEARIIGRGREVTGLRRNGEHFPMRLAIGEVRIDGQPLFVGFVADITERQAVEQSLHQTLEQLQVAKEDAEHAAEAKSAFLANMSHEIRTPMNAIIGLSELLLETPLEPGQQRHMNTLQRSARSLLHLLNNTLDAARLERSAVELERELFDLHALCEELIEMLQLQAEGKGLELQLDYRAAYNGLQTDPFRLRQVLLNLLGNAIKFTEQGRVELQVTEQEQLLLIRVQDTGIGIAADRLARIFDPFAQADASMSRRFGGTGLGLAIARDLSELMGGNLGVESSPGIGSCFTLTLPTRTEPMAPPPAAPWQHTPAEALLADRPDTMPRQPTVRKPSTLPSNAQALTLLQEGLARGELDQSLLDQALDALPDHLQEALQQALYEFDFDQAIALLQQLDSSHGSH